MFEVLLFIQKEQNIRNVPKELPLFFIAGGQDPVGHYGKDVPRVAASFERAGVEDISLKIYQEDRHELLNELDKDQVYKDVLSWMEQKL